jgi:nucleotide-binding universal stress UspA family protein
MSTSTVPRGVPLAGVAPGAALPAASGLLVVVADDAGTAAPPWVGDWCRSRGREILRHPGRGPAAAEGAAAFGARVLVLRPEPREAGTGPARVVAALRDLPDDALVVADAAEAAARLDAGLTVLHAVPRSFGERSVGLDGTLAHGTRLLAAAAGQVAVHGPRPPVEVRLLRMRPHELVGEALDADLLVLGGPRPGRGGLGLVARSALHHAPCPVLLTPRSA